MAVQGPPLFSPSSVEPGPQYFPVPESPGLVPNQGFKMEVNWCGLFCSQVSDHIILRPDIVVYTSCLLMQNPQESTFARFP